VAFTCHQFEGVPDLHPDCSHEDSLGGLDDIVIHTQVPDSQFPWRDGIGAHRLPISGLNVGLMHELIVNRIKHYRTFA
jgi:hypothetical protein